MLLHRRQALLRAHASALSSLGQAYARLASQHRIAAYASESGKLKITYDSHFRDWVMVVTELSAAAERLLGGGVRNPV